MFAQIYIKIKIIMEVTCMQLVVFTNISIAVWNIILILFIFFIILKYYKKISKKIYIVLFIILTILFYTSFNKSTIWGSGCSTPPSTIEYKLFLFPKWFADYLQEKIINTF